MTEPNSSDPVLNLEGVQLQLSSDAGPVSILRGIDLTVAAGDAVGVVGPSGSGKTSLLMVIAGLEKTTAGRITAAGTEISGLDEDSLARFRRDHIGIVFQNFHLVPTMSALENVALPLEFAGLGAGDGQNAFVRAEAELEAVGLGHRLAHYPGQLSGGEQQRVAAQRDDHPGIPLRVGVDHLDGRIFVEGSAFDAPARTGHPELDKPFHFAKLERFERVDHVDALREIRRRLEDWRPLELSKEEEIEKLVLGGLKILRQPQQFQLPSLVQILGVVNN